MNAPHHPISSSPAAATTGRAPPGPATRSNGDGDGDGAFAGALKGEGVKVRTVRTNCAILVLARVREA